VSRWSGPRRGAVASGEFRQRHEVSVTGDIPVQASVTEDDRATLSIAYGEMVITGSRADVAALLANLADRLSRSSP